MATICTEQGTCTQDGIASYNFGRMMLVGLASALLFSLIGSYNLSRDVADLTGNTVPAIQEKIIVDSPALVKEAQLSRPTM